MTRFISLSIIFKNFVNFISISKTINASDVLLAKNEHAVSFMNKCTLIADLEEIGIELQNFIGDETGFKGDLRQFETDKAANEQTYNHFKNAQRLFILTLNKINLLNNHPNEPLDRTKNIMQLLKLSIKLSPVILISTYTRILASFYVAYLQIYQYNLIFLDSVVTKEFILSLVTLHEKVHILTFIQPLNVAEIQALLSLEHENIVIDNKNTRPLKNIALEPFIIQNNNTLAKLLILAYKYPINCKVDFKVTPLYNPIIIAWEIIKKPDISIYNIERVAILLLDQLLILLFNDSGIEFINKKGLNTLFYYLESSKSIVGVDYTNLIICDNKKTRNKDYNISYNSFNAYINPYHTIKLLYEVFSFKSKQQIIAQIFNLILISCEKIDYEKMKFMWNFVLGEFSDVMKMSYNDEIIKFLKGKVAQIPTQNNRYYDEICDLTIFKILCRLYTIHIKGMIYSRSLGYMFYFLDIVRCIKGKDSNKIHIYQNQLKLLHELLQDIAANCYKDQFLNLLSAIFDVIIKKSYNICRLYNSTEDLGYIRSILGCILKILTKCLPFLDKDIILTHIENLLSSKILACFLPISKNSIDISFENLKAFLEASRVRYYDNVNFEKRIANISLQLFFILIDLEITLKKGQSSNINSENFEIIINYLRNKEFDRLKFKAYSHKMSINNYFKTPEHWSYDYLILMKTIAIINIKQNKQFRKSIEMVLLDAIQIRLRLPQEFKNILQLNAYNLILVSKSFNQLIRENRSLENTIGSQIDYKNMNDNILFDDRITEIFPLQPQDTYQLYVYTFLDVFCTIQRFKFSNQILVPRLDKIIIDLNALDHQLSALDSSNYPYFPEKLTFFKKLNSAIIDLAIALSNSTKTPPFYAESLLLPLQSIQNKLKDI